MQTVPEIAPTAQVSEAFYAHFRGLAGVITKPADAVLFLEHESGAVVTVPESEWPSLVVLGEVAEAMRQFMADMTAGGYAAIATSRAA
jgi:hypothetical protein